MIQKYDTLTYKENKKKGKLLSRRLDKVEDIDWENFRKLFFHYGHSYVFLLYIIMEILIHFLKHKTKYLIGS